MFEDPLLRVYGSCIVCQSTGELVAYSYKFENKVNVWNYKTSEVVCVVTVDDLKSIDVMTVSTAGLVYVASYSLARVVSIRLTSGEVTQSLGDLPFSGITSLKSTADSHFLVVAGYQFIVVWDLANNELVCKILSATILNSLSLSADRQMLIKATNDNLIHVYDLHRITDVYPVPQTFDLIYVDNHFNFVVPSQFDDKPNPRYMMVQSKSCIAVLDNKSGKFVKRIACRDVDHVLMVDDTTALVCTKQQLKVLDLSSAVVVKSLRGLCNYRGYQGLSLALLDKERVLVASRGRRHLKIISLVSGGLLEILKVDGDLGPIGGMVVSRDRTTAVCFRGIDAVVWNLASKAYKLLPKLDKFTTEISDDGLLLACVHSKSRHVASMYDLRETRVKYTLHEEGQINSVAIATATRRVLTGSRNNSVSIWDLDTGCVIRRLGDYEYEFHTLTMSRDGCRVLTSSPHHGKQSMRLYDILKCELLAAFTPDGYSKCILHPNNKEVLCQVGRPRIAKFRLVSAPQGKEQISDEYEEAVAWGEKKATMINETNFEDDDDDDDDGDDD